MKIESSPIDIYRQAADRVGGPTPQGGDSSAPAASAPRPSGDRVELSGDARVLQDAVASAQESPAIRQDVVERLRGALQRGEIGQDAGRIADAIIDSWIQES